MSRGSILGRRARRLAAGLAAVTISASGPGLAGAGAAPPDHAGPPADVLEERLRGEAAIEALGERLPEVAAANDVTPGELRHRLRADNQLWVDPTGILLFVDEGLADHAAEAPTTAAAPTFDDHAPAEAFSLHSRPGADRVIFLDFDGHDPSTSIWSDTSPTEPYDADGDPTTFSDAERGEIIDVWRRVAEDFAPFDIDVTTQDPGIDAIRRTDLDDHLYGTRVVITPTMSNCGGCGGVAYVGVYNVSGGSETRGWVHDRYQPAWVYTSGVGTGAKTVAEAASHEAGHNLGLSHDDTSTQGYYDGHGDWAPIMGVGYYQAITQWSQGEYADAQNHEDDAAVIGQHGGPLAADDHGDTGTAATLLAGTSVEAEGTIGTADDIDAFTFTAEAGTLTVHASPAAVGPNLDIGLTLVDADGATVAGADPAGLAAALDVMVAAGTYTVLVEGVGAGDPATTGYSDYGSVGGYHLTGLLPAGDVNQPPTVDPTASATTGTAPLTVGFTAGAADDGEVISYAWDFGDGATSELAAPTHVFETTGIHEVTVTVTDDEGAVSVSNPITITVVADQPPVVDAYADRTSGRTPLTVTLYGDDAFDPEGGQLSYEWSLDGALLSSERDTTVTIHDVGTHTATLTVTDATGQSSSDRVVLTVQENAAPTALLSATPSSGTAPVTVAFDGSGSSDPNGDQLSYAWDFGDGTATGNGVTTSHTYDAAGLYTVVLTVSDGLASATATATIEVAAELAPPTAPVLADPTVAADGTVTLTWTGADGADTVAVYREFLHKNGQFKGRSQVATVAGTAISYVDAPGSGTFRYQLEAVNAQGTALSATATVEVAGDTTSGDSGGPGGGNGKGNGGGKPDHARGPASTVRYR